MSDSDDSHPGGSDSGGSDSGGGGNDGIVPEPPSAEGLTPPELRGVEVEGARLLANEARQRLRSDGFTDTEIDAWARAYYTQDVDGVDEGDVDGLVEFIRAEEAGGRGPG